MYLFTEAAETAISLSVRGGAAAFAGPSLPNPSSLGSIFTPLEEETRLLEPTCYPPPNSFGGIVFGYPPVTPSTEFPSDRV